MLGKKVFILLIKRDNGVGRLTWNLTLFLHFFLKDKTILKQCYNCMPGRIVRFLSFYHEEECPAHDRRRESILIRLILSILFSVFQHDITGSWFDFFFDKIKVFKIANVLWCVVGIWEFESLIFYDRTAFFAKRI